MNFIPFIALFFILSAWVYFFIMTFRAQLSSMTGMMTAMAVGMSVGLGMGSLLTVIISDNFFGTTLLSMLVGGFTGTLIGWPKGLMAILDGLLSGVMGGMMGVMLLVMIPPSSTHTMLYIISLFTIAILFLVFILIHGEIATGDLHKKSFLISNPIWMFSTICLFLAADLFIM
ncbi:hypothetical protein MJ257_11470 [Paenibacillus timonensis]|uniref:DUF4203 domain-containing protein n=1 Tax=Paenibacillus timonensis TaxID=225915 RepID=A0ABW3SE53_9BACL|nr:hypothetical protein [Paenibacillus timonensis]MCH1640730.1 hypothetical protein [Paenibacillus timonensis]